MLKQYTLKIACVRFQTHTEFLDEWFSLSMRAAIALKSKNTFSIWTQFLVDRDKNRLSIECNISY